jgi:hypothetical protein
MRDASLQELSWRDGATPSIGDFAQSCRVAVRSCTPRSLGQVLLTVPVSASEHPAVDDDLDPREAARTRRRDREADAERRELLRPGMGKVFKQITDSWAEKAFEHEKRAQKGAGKGSKGPQ